MGCRRRNSLLPPAGGVRLDTNGIKPNLDENLLRCYMVVESRDETVVVDIVLEAEVETIL